MESTTLPTTTPKTTRPTEMGDDSLDGGLAITRLECRARNSKVPGTVV